MTYAGLKSMIYAGVEAEDPRVQAALDWIGRFYTLAENPGMGDAGLYYYFHTFGKALQATGKDSVRDAGGSVHDWRRELIATLAQRQQSNGSWVNANDRWLEGDAELVTAYALLAISYLSLATSTQAYACRIDGYRALALATILAFPYS